MSNSDKPRVLIGAGAQTFPGWIATQKEQLDLLDARSFERFFGKTKAAALVCEHVWEHLTEEEGRSAAQLCYDFLADDGFMRVAVPDGNFRDEAYQKLVQVGGPGPADHPAADHQVVYTLQTLAPVFESADFTVDPLEFCDLDGRFHYRHWEWHTAPIFRSFRTDARNRDLKLGFVSLIVELRKKPNQALQTTRLARPEI